MRWLTCTGGPPTPSHSPGASGRGSRKCGSRQQEGVGVGPRTQI